MPKFSNVLYVVNALNFSCTGLSTAVNWARQSDGHCRVTIIYPQLPQSKDQFSSNLVQGLERDFTHRVERYLDENGLSQTGLVDIDVITHEKPAMAAVEQSLLRKADVIIKSTEDDSAGFRAFDNTLLRKASCPVYLVREEPPQATRKLAVAIDAASMNDEEKQLSLRLLKVSAELADKASVPLNIIACWQFVFEDFISSNVWSKLDDAEQITLLRDYEKSNHDSLEELIEESGINPEQGVVIHHKRGVVDVLVPLMIKSLDIDTLVMGTLARTGFSGMLIGNTAENLLQKVSCSVLAFKPEAFRSPLDKRV